MFTNSLCPYFFSCDWGSTNVRLRLVNFANGEILKETATAAGVSQMCAPGMATEKRQSALGAELERLIAELEKTTDIPLQTLPIVLSGMVTSAHGWCEIPYATTPLDLANPTLNTYKVQWKGHSMIFVSGLRTENDVMRGEEVELLGLKHHFKQELLSGQSVIILPGTHSKHVFIENGRIMHFQTYLTGELFDVLGRHSVLRHSVNDEESIEHPDEFTSGVTAAMKHPLSQNLFQVRTRFLLHGISASANRSYLSGLLIGDELINLADLPAKTRLILAAGSRLESAYGRAFEILNVPNVLTHISATDTAQLSSAGHKIILEHVTGDSLNQTKL